MAQLYLASKSPRRHDLLRQIGVAFRILDVSVDETPEPDEVAVHYVERLACAKARSGVLQLPEQESEDAVCLGADTVVVLDGRILGKPQDFSDAQRMLRALSGRTHKVMTAIALADRNRLCSRLVVSDVTFRTLTSEQIEAYWATGEPCDKAGGYGIQGLAAVFVRQLKGSYSAVVGLPLCETAELLEQFGVACWQA